MDDIHLSCQARLAKDGDAPLAPSDYFGVRGPADPPGTPVILYGASWCSACHAAAEYMARLGIPFVEKDVEEDRAARDSVAAKMQTAGLGPKAGRVLPVMDVRGTIIAGFVPCVLERAWAAR
jgi:glutaredoxin